MPSAISSIILIPASLFSCIFHYLPLMGLSFLNEPGGEGADGLFCGKVQVDEGLFQLLFLFRGHPHVEDAAVTLALSL